MHAERRVKQCWCALYEECTPALGALVVRVVHHRASGDEAQYAGRADSRREHRARRSALAHLQRQREQWHAIEREGRTGALDVSGTATGKWHVSYECVGWRQSRRAAQGTQWSRRSSS